MSAGKDFQVYVSPSGTVTTGLLNVEMQSDLTINLGKSNNRTAFKNGALTAQGNDGFSASFSIGMVEPMPTGQTELWDAHDGGTDLYVEVKRTSTGAMRFKGNVKCVITEIGMPVNGVRMATVELSETGTITRDTN